MDYRLVKRGKRDKRIIANPAIKDKMIQKILNFGEYIITKIILSFADRKEKVYIWGMRIEEEASFIGRCARLGIEPIEPGRTFRFIRPGTYIGEEVAREILEMHPKRPKILTLMARLGSPVKVIQGQLASNTALFERRFQIGMSVKDLTEITEIALHGLACALPAALGGGLAAVAGISLLVAASVPRMVITGEFPLLSPTEDTKTAIGLLLAEFVGFGSLIGLAGGISEARNYPYNRFFRFS